MRGEETPKDAVEHGRGVPLVPEGPLAPPAPSSGAVEPGPNPSDFLGEDYGKLGVGVEKPELVIKEVLPHALDALSIRGGSMVDVEETIDNPLMVLRQTRGRYFYLSDKAGVVLNTRGQVITTYPATEFDARIKEILDHVHQGGRK